MPDEKEKSDKQTKPSKSQFRGCIIGQCLGDAMGFPVEGSPPETCSEYVEDVLKTGRTGKVVKGGCTFGQYTDDSQLARELLSSLVENNGFDPEDYAQKIADIFATNRIVGRGMSTTKAAMKLSMGVSWEKSGTPAPLAGNGSAMRAAPVGMFYYDDREKLVEAAVDQGRITHADPRCKAGSVVIAGAVGVALLSGGIDPGEFLETLRDMIKDVDPGFAGHLYELSGWLKLPPTEAVKHISRAGIEPGYRETWRGISPFVVGSVLWSLYSFLRSPQDYNKSIYTSIAVGGDVDTTAAMTGAISGAYLGMEGIPTNLARKVNDRGEWGFEKLIQLADKCYRLKMNTDLQ